MLRILTVEDNVGEQVDGAHEVLALYGGIEHGVLLVGEGVEVAADAL